MYVNFHIEYMEMYGNVIHTISDLLAFISHCIGECRLIDVCRSIIGGVISYSYNMILPGKRVYIRLLLLQNIRNKPIVLNTNLS